MPLWAGIDEAGYGPPLGPLVAAGTAFQVRGAPSEGMLWQVLSDAVGRRVRTADGRLVVDDSKLLYSRARGLRCLEEGALGFLSALGDCPRTVDELLGSVAHPAGAVTDDSPWSRQVGLIRLPVESNPSAVASKASALAQTLRRTGVPFAWARACVVPPGEFNHIVERTRNKSYLLFQKCGLLLQDLWRMAGNEEIYVLVDRHGGRIRYRRLLKDAFPHCECDVLRENAEGSVYRLSDGERVMLLGFKEKADSLALPVALASMLAKYLRELHMLAFNAYWQERIEGLRPTAGYARDARRFLRDIAPLIEADGIDLRTLVRAR